MAIIQLSDVVTPEMYDEYFSEEWTTKSALIRSGIVGQNDKMNMLLAGGASTFNFPFWKVNDMASQAATPVDEGTTITPAAITAGKQVARRLFFEKAWGQNDVVVVNAGDDPLEAALSHLGKYWEKQSQTALFSSVQGVIADNIANDSGDLVVDITGLTDSVINSDAVIDAIGKFGDQVDEIVGIGMHSIPYQRLQKDNLIDFRPDNEQNIGWGVYLGKTVIVDDSLKVGTEYFNIIFKSNAFMSGESSEGYVPLEIDRNPAASGGVTNLYSRRVIGMHPAGFAWQETAAVTTTFPTFANMALASEWNRVVDGPKNCGFSVLKTLG